MPTLIGRIRAEVLGCHPKAPKLPPCVALAATCYSATVGEKAGWNG